ncbi:hypothetical protein HFO09_29215 [Rhizobium laguerreae]|uniref:hypothetical protein n=1 Tax=Rhizobium laguerreae TaxID=1076926 RepID=UPI001C925B55|nr:hypothetical protein [Rhizobium laguerreae]MBY3258449.1 hypothetical protein [Rhizobium laguerreae]MBY3286436.1 hypothetical protein [Rhizobium laguerreae]MBY3293099.1 hypothetical protein [Rhizobium laguerreae]
MKVLLPALLLIVTIGLPIDAGAGTIEKDDRGALTELGGSLGLSQDNIIQLKSAVGGVWCPGTKYGNPMFASAALVRDAQTIVTVAHVFIDESMRRREPIAGCVFITLSGVEVPVSSVHPATIDPYRSPFLDKAVAYLDRPIVDVLPLNVGSLRMPAVGDPLLGISGAEVGMTFKSDAVLRAFNVKSLHPERLFYNSDADLTEGGCGGINFVVRQASIVVVGMFVRGALRSDDGKPYDEAKGVMTTSILLGDLFSPDTRRPER